MDTNDQNETKSYRDPLAGRSQAAQSAREQRLARFPSVETSYDGFYLRIDPDTPEGRRALAGSDGIIGSRLKAVPSKGHEASGEAVSAAVRLLTQTGITLATLTGKDAEKIGQALRAGWSINIVLSLVVYSKEQDGFWAEAACICYDTNLGPALAEFTKNIIYRISRGTHPGLQLNQEQFVRVIESNGAWYLTKDTPLPEREKGAIVYKSRKVWSEYLVEAAAAGNLGCKFAAGIFWVVVIVVAIWFVWRFLFSG